MGDVFLWSLGLLVVGVFYYIIGEQPITFMLKGWLGYTMFFTILIIIDKLRSDRGVAIPVLTLTILIIACVFLFF